jgi:3-isopropylmalate/(R)-2-methylmalate dehydratase large subunit
MPKSLFEKIWDEHVVRDLGGGWALLHIDRHLLHDLSGPPALATLAKRGLSVRNPELVFASPDHAVSSAPSRTAQTFELGGRLYDALKAQSHASGIRFFDLGEEGQGIVHVMGPELGLVLPGLTLICGDSHTCTNGGLGALAFGVGQSESAHALATATLRQQRPNLMRVRFDGAMGQGVTPKDLILNVIGKLGAAAGAGYAVEYAGSCIRSMPVEGRLTVCNLTVELGGKYGLVAPDDMTFAYIEGRRFAPCGVAFERAVAHWRTLFTDDGAQFDRDEIIDASEVAPTVTWGTSPRARHRHRRHSCPNLRAPATPKSARRSRQRSATWRSRPGAPSLERRSTGCSSARARTRASPICAPPRRSRATGTSRPL